MEETIRKMEEQEAEMISKLSATMATFKQKHSQLESTKKARLEPREVRRDNYYYISSMNSSSRGGALDFSAA